MGIKRKKEREGKKNKLLRQGWRETETGKQRCVDRERKQRKAEGRERKEVGRVVDEGEGMRGEEEGSVMLCDLGQVSSLSPISPSVKKDHLLEQL